MRKEFGLNNKNKNPEQIDKLIFEIEGRLNDFENGLTDKEDTIKSFAFFIGECVKTAVENSQVELPVKPANGDIVKTIKDFFDNYLYDVDNCYEINKINHKKTGNISFAALVLLQAKEKLLSRLSV